MYFFLISAFIASIYFVSWIVRTIRKKQFQIVSENSLYYKSVQMLNQETRYRQKILDAGCDRYVKTSFSKYSFDHTSPLDVLIEYLGRYSSEINDALYAIEVNKNAFAAYEEKLSHLKSVITEEECGRLKISLNRFQAIEGKLVSSEIEKIQMVRSITITCCVEYTSPQGRNHYRKSAEYHDDEIRDVMKSLSAQEILRTHEEYRRKVERGKMSAKLRYRIMSRDGFRCQICGRSAKDGVELEVDHIIPVSKGGTTSPLNLRTLCRDCNRGKGNQTE